jgi:hypothetical protein
MSALCKAYSTHDAATSAVLALKEIGIGGDRLRVLTGEPLHDVRKEDVGGFEGSVGPDAPVGSFGDVAHERSDPKGDFGSTGSTGRVGTFADADIDTVTTYDDGVGRMRITGDHDVEGILTDAGLDPASAQRDVRALHSGWSLVLVRHPGADADRIQRVLDEAS